jgi:biopolymer transport protein ExbD
MLKELNESIKNQIINSKSKMVVATATITPKSGVNYGELIQTIDVLRKNKIVNIGVLTERGQ